MQSLSTSDRTCQGVIAQPHSAPKPVRPRAWILLLNLLATVQFVWFYVSLVPSEFSLLDYERGLAETPFQYRLLLMLPLRWAHQSPTLNHLANNINPIWFSRTVHPEDILLIAVDVLCVVITGVIATKLYTESSSGRLLTPVVYPLTVAMCACTYALLIVHQFRYVYDLPSLAFFAIGLYLIYSRKHPLLFACLFVIATANRETTLFLLLCFVIESARSGLKNLLRLRTVAVVAPLSAYWIGWHMWVSAHYVANPSAAAPRVAVNVALLASWIAWPQLLAACGYLIPMAVLSRKLILDPLLRAWLWILLPWFCFMLYYGVLIEARVFGELIPYIACVTALILEENLLAKANLLRQPTPVEIEGLT